jgi:hypothetical protein
MQSVPITTDVVSSDPAQGEVYNMSVTCGRSVVFTGYSGFLHDITEILLKVALNTIGQIQTKTNYNGSQRVESVFITVTINKDTSMTDIVYS